MSTDRLILVTSSPRLPAGLLSWHGWQALRSGPVHAADPDTEQARAVRHAGVEVRPLPGGAADSASPRQQAARFRELARGGRTVVWLVGPDGDSAFGQALGDLVAREGTAELEVVYGSWDPPGARLLDVVATVDRLYSPGGCPWDREQNHESLMPYLLEEAYEAYQALEDGDLTALREELGDVLFQVVFHARLAEDAEDADDQPAGQPWSIDDVAGDLVAKLVRRHPHVFAGEQVSGPEQVRDNWEQLKRAERAGRSMTESVPLALPALTLAATLYGKAVKAGVPDDVLPGGAEAGGIESGGTGLGGRLFALVRAAHAAGQDPEVALRAVSRAFRDDLAEAERRARAAGLDPYELTSEQWLSHWPSMSNGPASA